MWICPVCQSLLVQVDRQWRCTNNHCYDIAKEGYVNLLLANQKRASEPGDNKAMINARRRFLELDHYYPLVEVMAQLIARYSKAESINVYDAGCGEGYYLHRISKLLQQQFEVTAAGNDISKIAVQRAAKKYHEYDFAIASNFNIPVQASSQDTLIQIFSPGEDEEVYRILKEDGLWLRISPAETHLCQLKQALYLSPQHHVADAVIPQGFTELEKRRLSFDFQLEDEIAREQLLMMTPYFWSAKQDQLKTWLRDLSLLTADFNIRLFSKRH